MHVAHRARDLAGRDLEDLHGHRRVEVALAARLDLRVAAAGQQRRQPADLELAADDDQQVGAAHRENEARLRINEVRILVALRERRDRHLVAADLARERAEIFGRGHDLQLRAGDRRRQQHQEQNDSVQ